MNRVRRTSPIRVATLLTIGLLVGIVLRTLAAELGWTVPRVGWAAAVVLLFCAAAVALLARNTWQSLHTHKRRMISDHGVKLLAIAKSSIIVGSLFGGFYGGIALAYVRDWDTPFGQDRVLQGGAAAITGILLLVAALFLERALQVPGSDDDDSPTGSASSAA